VDGGFDVLVGCFSLFGNQTHDWFTRRISGSFATNAAVASRLNQPTNQGPFVFAKPDFAGRGQRKSSNSFSGVLPKPADVGSPNGNVPFPKAKPTLIEAKDLAVAATNSNPNSNSKTKAESVGRQRAKQLAALTSGLPERLNQIQSSVKRATAVLQTKVVASDKNPPTIAENQFVPTSPRKRPTEASLKPLVEPPRQFATQEPAKAVKPIPIQPVIEHTFTSQPLIASPALPSVPDPALTSIPSPTVARIPKPLLKENPGSNAFVSLPSLRPLATPVAPKVTVEASRMPKLVEPAGKSSQVQMPVEPVRQVSHSRPELKRHVVQAGESFFTIAQQHYGDGQWFRALRLANQSVAGSELPVGVSLAIPTTAELTRQFPEVAVRTADDQPTEAQQRIYVTQAGDTLFDIARRKTGQGSRFSEIMGDNELRLPEQIRASDQLPEGLHLVLPESSLQ